MKVINDKDFLKIDCSKYWWPYCALLEPDIAEQWL